MKRVGIILLLLLGFALTPQAQQRRKPAAKKIVTTGKSRKSGKSGKSNKSTAKQPTTVQALDQGTGAPSGLLAA